MDKHLSNHRHDGQPHLKQLKILCLMALCFMICLIFIIIQNSITVLSSFQFVASFHFYMYKQIVRQLHIYLPLLNCVHYYYMIQDPQSYSSFMSVKQFQPEQITVRSILQPNYSKNKPSSILCDVVSYAGYIISKAKTLISQVLTQNLTQKSCVQSQKKFEPKNSLENINFNANFFGKKQQLKAKKVQKKGRGINFDEWFDKQTQKINKSYIRKRIAEKKHNRSQNSQLNISNNQTDKKKNKVLENKTILNISEINSQFSQVPQKNRTLLNHNKSMVSLQYISSGQPNLLKYPDFSIQQVFDDLDNQKIVLHKFDLYKRQHQNKGKQGNQIITKKVKIDGQYNKKSKQIYEKLITQMQIINQKNYPSHVQSYKNFQRAQMRYFEDNNKISEQSIKDLPNTQKINQNPLISRRKMYNFKVNDQVKFDPLESFQTAFNAHQEQINKQQKLAAAQAEKIANEQIERQRIQKQKQDLLIRTQQINRNRKEQQKLKQHQQSQRKVLNLNQQEILAQQYQESKNKPAIYQLKVHNINDASIVLKQPKNAQNIKTPSFEQIQKTKIATVSQVNQNAQNKQSNQKATQLQQITQLQYKVSVNQSNYPQLITVPVPIPEKTPESPKATVNQHSKSNNPFLNPPSNKKITLQEIMKKDPQMKQRMQGFNFASPTKIPALNSSLYNSPEKKSGLFDLVNKSSQLSTPIFNNNNTSNLILNVNQIDSSMCDQISQSNVPAIDNSFAQNSLSNSFSGPVNMFPNSNLHSNSGSNLFSNNLNNSFSKNGSSIFPNNVPAQDSINLNMFAGNFNPQNMSINSADAVGLFMTKSNSIDNINAPSIFGNVANMQAKKSNDRDSRKKRGKQQRIS